jgi:hypothetical protein
MVGIVDDASSATFGASAHHRDPKLAASARLGAAKATRPLAAAFYLGKARVSDDNSNASSQIAITDTVIAA